ncbi:hypothetical protein RUM44_011478 [Polyplax serrata]|uniref:Uncharacterized protein n=1 Tax=Polyplax serrata TaxID=468196 RepID=A0ABR1ARP3_POLSC
MESDLEIMVRHIKSVEMTWSEKRLVRDSLSTTELPDLVNELGGTFPPNLPVSFLTENSSTVTAQTGSTALIPCIVLNIGDGLSLDVLHAGHIVNFDHPRLYQALQFLISS